MHKHGCGWNKSETAPRRSARHCAAKVLWQRYKLQAGGENKVAWMQPYLIAERDHDALVERGQLGLIE